MSEINPGYHIRRNNPDVDLKDKDSSHSFNYPSGIVPYIFNWVIFLTILFVGIFVSNKEIKIYSGIIASLFSMSFNAVWWMGRYEFMSGIRYSLHSIAKKMRLLQLKEKIDYKDVFPTKEFSSDQEFKQYIKERLDFTKKWYFISWITFLILAVISTIVMLVLKFGFNF